MSEHDRPRDDELADYLLGESGDEHRQETDRRLNAAPDARAEADALGAIAADLEQLPGEAWPAAPDPAPGRTGWIPRPALVALACAALLAVGAAAGALMAGGDGDPATPANLRLSAIEGERGSASAGFASNGDDRRLRVSVRNVAPSRRGEFYELWLLGDGGRLLSLGSFTIDGSGSREVELPVPADSSRYGSIDLSREPADGNPGHSKRSVLRGPAA